MSGPLRRVTYRSGPQIRYVRTLRQRKDANGYYRNQPVTMRHKYIRETLECGHVQEHGLGKTNRATARHCHECSA